MPLQIQSHTLEPERFLYGLERDGSNYRAAFYEQDGDAYRYKPVWKDIKRDSFYDLAEQYTCFVKHYDFGKDYVLQLYCYNKQLEAWKESLELIADEMDYQDAVIKLAG